MITVTDPLCADVMMMTFHLLNVLRACCSRSVKLSHTIWVVILIISSSTASTVRSTVFSNIKVVCKFFIANIRVNDVFCIIGL